jgi:hypothetical protein
MEPAQVKLPYIFYYIRIRLLPSPSLHLICLNIEFLPKEGTPYALKNGLQKSPSVVLRNYYLLSLVTLAATAYWGCGINPRTENRCTG